MNMIAGDHLGLVGGVVNKRINILSRWIGRTEAEAMREDLFNTGVVGLCVACRRWNESTERDEADWPAHASCWIRRMIQRESMKIGALVVSQKNTLEYCKVTRELRRSETTAEAVSRAFPHKIPTQRRVLRMFIVLTMPSVDAGMVATNPSDGSDAASLIVQAMRRLRPEHREILERCGGLNGQDPVSQVDLAREKGVTPAAISSRANTARSELAKAYRAIA